jgi:hypothetical protein
MPYYHYEVGAAGNSARVCCDGQLSVPFSDAGTGADWGYRLRLEADASYQNPALVTAGTQVGSLNGEDSNGFQVMCVIRNATTYGNEFLQYDSNPTSSV